LSQVRQESLLYGLLFGNPRGLPHFLDVAGQGLYAGLLLSQLRLAFLVFQNIPQTAGRENPVEVQSGHMLVPAINFPLLYHISVHQHRAHASGAGFISLRAVVTAMPYAAPPSCCRQAYWSPSQFLTSTPLAKYIASFFTCKV